MDGMRALLLHLRTALTTAGLACEAPALDLGQDTTIALKHEDLSDFANGQKGRITYSNLVLFRFEPS
jgi:hypothetical protein